MVEGYGYYGSGKAGDPNGAIVYARLAMDAGNYRRLGRLEPQELDRQIPTLKTIQEKHELQREFAQNVVASIK